MDHVYIPYTRTSGNQQSLSRYIDDANPFISLLPEQCREIGIKLLCNYYFIPCGNSSAFQPPVSVCSEQCFHVRNDLCPNEWKLIVEHFRNNPELVALGLAFIECNNTGLILEPLPYRCTDAGITLRKCYCKYSTLQSYIIINQIFILYCIASPTPTPSPTVQSTNTAAAISAGVGGTLLTVCVLVAVTVIAVVIHAKRRKRRKEREETDVSVHVLQELPPLSPREEISSSR